MKSIIITLLILITINSYANDFEKLILKYNFQNISLEENNLKLKNYSSQQMKSIVVINKPNCNFNTFMASMSASTSQETARFFLGALFGAGVGALAGHVIETKSAEDQNGDGMITSSDVDANYGVWVLGGALLGGILFTVDL